MKKLAVVTGGTRGIGTAIAISLKKAGCDVAVNYHTDNKSAAEFTKQTGLKAFKWDVSSLKDCEKGIKAVISEFGRAPDILVNNAGIIRDSMLHNMAEENWHDIIDTNLTSCFNMCRSVLIPMRNNGFGRIINISSINALSGQIGQTNYAAAKAGILGFTKSLARENACKGITVNAVAPGYIKTDMTRNIPIDIMNSIVSQIPVKRLGKPEEIARAVAFLAADDAGFITGETISINGGHHMQ